MNGVTHLNDVISAGNPVHRYRALKGKMFVLESIYFHVSNTDSGEVVSFVDRWVEDKDVAAGGEAFLQIFMDNVHANQVILHGLETKYITVMPGASVSGVLRYTIFYRLKSATKTDLIWEWFSKRR